jgi:hypothetical protein
MAAMSIPDRAVRPLLNRRLAEFGTTVFAEMSALAAAIASVAPAVTSTSVSGSSARP